MKLLKSTERVKKCAPSSGIAHFFKRPILALSNCLQRLAAQPQNAAYAHQGSHSKTPDELDALTASINDLSSKLLLCSTQLNAKELELRNTESVFIHVLNATPLSIFWKDINSCYLGCNQNFASLVGLVAPEHIIGKTDFDLPFSAAEAAEFQSIDRAVINDKQPHQMVAMIKSPDAGGVWLDITQAALTNASGTVYGVFGVGVDITERKHAENSLRQSEQRFRSYFELPLTGIVITSTEKNWLNVNDRACEIVGYTKEELLQQTWSSMTHPDDLAADVEKFNIMLAGTIDQYTLEKRFIRKDGSIVYVDLSVGCVRRSDSSVDYVVAIFNDITERIKSQHELIRLSAVVEQVNEIIVITDKQAVIQYVNPAFTKATGYTSAEALGHTPALLRSGKQDTVFYKMLWSTISQGEIWQGRFVNRKKNGELYNEEATIYPLRSGSGEIINYVAVKRDITHDLKIEHQLRQVQKMEAIGSLAGGIAHDFNNILGVIYGYAEMSMDPSETLPQINSNLQQLLSAANRAKDLIRHILTISRQTEKEALPITMTPIVKEVIKFIRASLPSSIQIKQSLSVKNDLLLADPVQIHQLLMNLCTNAGHAMKDSNGVLEITLKNVHFTDTDILEYPLMRSGDYICLSVQDTGCGIPPGNMEHIFEPYFTTKESSEGTGLGLAVVHGIVGNCGGDIRVYSEVGKGTAFNVYLPIITREPEKTNETVQEIPRGTEHILFVDDEISLVRTSKIILERLGYAVTAITSAEEALTVFKNTPDAFDLLITDKTMPELTGFDLVREIKSRRPELPMILCTGVSVKADIDKVQKLGINGFLLKPFNKRELACIIRDVLDKKHVPQWELDHL